MSTNHKPLLLLGGLGALGLLALAAAAGSTDTAKTTWRHGMDWIDRVIDRVSKHEGKHDSLNLNLDGAGLSFGIIQWAQIVGNLGKLLTAMQQADPSTFAATFGPHWQQLLAVTNAATRGARMQPVGGVVLWKEPWASRFRQAGRTPVFVQVQNQLAAQGHHWVGAIEAARLLGFATERSVALMYDTSVQQGPDFAKKHARRIHDAYAHRPSTQREILTAYASSAPAHFRRSTPPSKPYPVSHIEWRKTGDEWHAWAGSFDLYTGIIRRRMGIVNDPTLSDTPLEIPS
jgi:hypothetical protein